MPAKSFADVQHYRIRRVAFSFKTEFREAYKRVGRSNIVQELGTTIAIGVPN